MSTDWSACCICQKDTKEKLRSTAKGHETFSKLLPQFAVLNELEFEISRLETPGLTLEESLKQQNAFYHHSCSNRYNQRMLDRALEKAKKGKNRYADKDTHLQSPPCKRRSDSVKPVERFGLFCCFCREKDTEDNLHAAGTKNASKAKSNIIHVDCLTEKWKTMATKIGDDYLLRILSCGDVTANEIYYHKKNIKPCLSTFHNKYKAACKDTQDHNSNYDVEWLKVSVLDKVYFHMCEMEQQVPSTVFEVKDLERMYIDLLQCHDIIVFSHVSRFAELLIARHDELEKRNIGKKIVVYFKGTADAFLSDALSAPSFFLRSMHELVMPLRKILSSKSNDFDGSFEEDCQTRSVPIELLTLISMLIDGPFIHNRNFSQPALTISQLILSNFRQKPHNNFQHTHQRTNVNHETPVHLYIALKLYSTVRSKTLIDHMFHLGICSSYDRVLEVTKSLSDDSTKQYKHDGVFCPSKLKKGVFTIIAKDNCDLNATSSTATMHYHGTSMTVMQCPTRDKTGEKIPKPIIHPRKTASKKVLCLPSSYVETKPVYFPKGPLYAPKCETVSNMYDNEDLHSQERMKEIIWLEKVSHIMPDDTINIDSWAKHHANQKRVEEVVPGINAILPLIPKQVHTLETQYHCMNITKSTTVFLNPHQTPVDVCDQPVFALTKEIQFRKPDVFGSSWYFSLLGGLHIEHCLLSLHGELIKGSGMYEILTNNNFSIISTGAVVNANHIKQARYGLQVVVCAIYFKLKEACSNSNSSLEPMMWLQEHKNNSQMCFYWDMILNFEIDILLYIRAIRESNFHLYVLCLKSLMKWFFALDHYNYARWATVHLMDLNQLHINCPDIYEEFKAGHFTFQKNSRQFSKMAPDQVHEQNNAVIKGTSGATHLLNRQDTSGLERWELCSHEISRIVTEFESDMNLNIHNVEKKKHHEDTPAFQKRFTSDVKKLLLAMAHNPFELNKLTKINNINVSFDDKVFQDLSKMIDAGQEQFHSFWKERLVTASTPLDAPIKKNSFLTPGKFEEQKKESHKKLIYSNEIMNKLRSACDLRRDKASQLFETELFGVAQSLAKNATGLFHNNKSDILKKFTSYEEHGLPESSAVVIDFSPILKGTDITQWDTFSDLAKGMYDKICCLYGRFKRIDLIFDQYFKGSLKEALRDERGIGSCLLFNSTTKLPVRFHSEFLKNSENKNRLSCYLAKQFIELHKNSKQTLVVTYEHTILASNVDVQKEINIAECQSEEADQRIVRHVLNLQQCTEYKNILACTYDTDVLILLLAYYPSMEPLSLNLICQFGFGANKKYYNIKTVASSLGMDKCRALPFFYAFSGCDTVSSFYGHSKTKFLDAWLKSGNVEELTSVFKELSNQPTEVTKIHMDIIEEFIKSLYYPNIKNVEALDIERLKHFSHLPDPNLRALPPSRNGLTEHTKRAALQAGWIWAEAVSNVEQQNPELWGWTNENGHYSPRWHLQNNETIVMENVCKTCNCQKALCKNCKCAKDMMKCLPFCGCHGKCQN